LGLFWFLETRHLHRPKAASESFPDVEKAPVRFSSAAKALLGALMLNVAMAPWKCSLMERARDEQKMGSVKWLFVLVLTARLPRFRLRSV
jgi:hypothetical protein